MIVQNKYRLMSNELDPKTDRTQIMVYQIRVKGHVSREWTDWFEGLTITLKDNGETLLTGPMIDQAALHGVLRWIRDLGIPLLSVTYIEPDQTNTTEAKQTQE